VGEGVSGAREEALKVKKPALHPNLKKPADEREGIKPQAPAAVIEIDIAPATRVTPVAGMTGISRHP